MFRPAPLRLLRSHIRNPLFATPSSTVLGPMRQCSNVGPAQASPPDSSQEDLKRPIVIPPTRHLAVLTCMDARINPFTQLGLKEGEAHIIRNAGGMARDALRSLVISQRLLGTREIAVYHHTGCGMVTFTGSSLRKLVKDEERGRPEAAELVDNIDFLEFGDLEQSVRDDVKFLQESPLILEGTKVTGWIHHVETGKAEQIV